MTTAKNNPFSSRHVESLAYQFIDVPLEDILKRLKTLNYRGAIVGPEGSGKTTLMETLGGLLRREHFQIIYKRFDRENKKLTRDFFNHISGTDSTARAFLIDGAEALSWPVRKQLFRHIKNAGAILVTAHSKTQFPTLVNTRTSPVLLYRLVLNLVGENDMVPRGEIRHLFASHNGNIRLALRELYDVWADK